MAEKDKKSIYELDLHEEVFISTGLKVTRVPGGWIYTKTVNNSTMMKDTSALAVTSTFVKLNLEFKDKKHESFMDPSVH